PVGPIDQDGELDPPRAPEVDDGVERRPDGAAGVEDVVHQQDGLAGDRERDVGSPQDRGPGLEPEVVAVERDVERPDRDLEPLDRLEPRGDPLSQRHAAGADPHQGQPVGVPGALEDLVGDPGEGALDAGLVEDLGLLPERHRVDRSDRLHPTEDRDPEKHGAPESPRVPDVAPRAGIKKPSPEPGEGAVVVGSFSIVSPKEPRRAHLKEPLPDTLRIAGGPVKGRGCVDSPSGGMTELAHGSAPGSASMCIARPDGTSSSGRAPTCRDRLVPDGPVNMVTERSVKPRASAWSRARTARLTAPPTGGAPGARRSRTT